MNRKKEADFSADSGSMSTGISHGEKFSKLRDAEYGFYGLDRNTLIPVELQPDDAKQIWTLCQEELGYSTSIEQIRATMEFARKHHCLLMYGIKVQGTLAGMIQLLVYPAVYGRPELEIVALAVSGPFQNRQLGSILLKKAEYTARKLGVKIIRVTSNMKRTKAHKFYENRGYIQIKQSAVFEKKL